MEYINLEYDEFIKLMDNGKFEEIDSNKIYI